MVFQPTGNLDKFSERIALTSRNREEVRTRESSASFFFFPFDFQKKIMKKEAI